MLRPDDDPLDSNEASRTWCAIVAQAGRTVLVADTNSELAGTADCAILPYLTRAVRPIMLVENVVVAADHQRSGVGRGLLRHAVELAIEAGCYKVHLLSDLGDPEVNAFYSACGNDTAVTIWTETRERRFAFAMAGYVPSSKDATKGNGRLMKAAWYECQGPASDVLVVGEMPAPAPEGGEVRVRLSRSGVNPGEVKKRQGWSGLPMPYPRVVPHSDGAGVIDAVGEGVDEARVGRRVWVYGAQSYRPFGTAAEATVVPDRLAVDLPDTVSDNLGASLGIPGITAHRAVFAHGPVTGRVVLVHGVLGAVGSFAAQLARWGGATVIGSVRRGGDINAMPRFLDRVVALDAPDVVARIRALAPSGVDRIIEVALSDNINLDAEVVANNAVIAAYSSPDGRPSLPLWPLLFANVTLLLLGGDDFPVEAKDQAARDLSAIAAADALTARTAALYGLDEIAAAHVAVENGGHKGRVIVATS
jgi:NADPH2:quinone reductase